MQPRTSEQLGKGIEQQSEQKEQEDGGTSGIIGGHSRTAHHQRAIGFPAGDRSSAEQTDKNRPFGNAALWLGFCHIRLCRDFARRLRLPAAGLIIEARPPFRIVNYRASTALSKPLVSPRYFLSSAHAIAGKDLPRSSPRLKSYDQPKPRGAIMSTEEGMGPKMAATITAHAAEHL